MYLKIIEQEITIINNVFNRIKRFQLPYRVICYIDYKIE